MRANREARIPAKARRPTAACKSAQHAPNLCSHKNANAIQMQKALRERATNSSERAKVEIDSSRLQTHLLAQKCAG